MGEIQAIADKLRAVNLELVALQVAREQIHVAIDLNTEAQLFERGITSTGESLGDYSPRTIEYKKGKGQRYDHVTLHDEGDYVGAWFARTEKFPITFGSKDVKAPLIEDHYGGLFGLKNDIYGLTRDSTDEFSEHTKPYIAELAAKKIREAFH